MDRWRKIDNLEIENWKRNLLFVRRNVRNAKGYFFFDKTGRSTGKFTMITFKVYKPGTIGEKTYCTGPWPHL